METQTAPRPTQTEMPQPEAPPIILDGTIVDTGHFRGTARVPQPGESTPPAEAQLPAPIKLTAREAQKRVTPIKGAQENWRGDYTITDTKSQGQLRKERLAQSFAGNFAVQALGRAVKHIQNRKQQWQRKRYWR